MSEKGRSRQAWRHRRGAPVVIFSTEEIAAQLGTSQRWVQLRLSLLEPDGEVKAAYLAGDVQLPHARVPAAEQPHDPGAMTAYVQRDGSLHSLENPGRQLGKLGVNVLNGPSPFVAWFRARVVVALAV